MKIMENNFNGLQKLKNEYMDNSPAMYNGNFTLDTLDFREQETLSNHQNRVKTTRSVGRPSKM